MTQEELQALLLSKKPISVEEVLKAIYDLKLAASINKADSNSDSEYYFHDGEVNAYLTCLDLLKKWKDDKGRR